MLLTLGTVAIVIVLILMWRHQTEERGGALPDEASAPAGAGHHAVSVRFDKKKCCVAVRELGMSRFLSSEAPALPLDGCDRPGRCTCVYRHLADRRGRAGRRATDHGFGEALYYGPERRSGEDRRNEAMEGLIPVLHPEPRDYFLR